MNKQPVYYNQYNEPQASFPYPSQAHPDATGKTSGCGPTCYAMVHASLLNPKYTPIDAMKDTIAMNDRGLEGTEDEYFDHSAAKYKLCLEKTKNLNIAIEALKKGKLVICEMQNWFKPGYGHFILAWGLSGNKIQINDPASVAYTQKLHEQSVFQQKCIDYFIFSKPVEVIMKDWKTIIKENATDSTAWEKAINTIVKIADAGNVGDLEICKYLPQLIEKIGKGA